MLELETNFVEQGTMEISTEIYTKDLDCGANSLHFEMDHGKLSAAVQNTDGSFTVKPEYMTQLARVNTPEILDAFLKNAFVKISQLDNGDFKFEVSQKANGGMPPKDNDKGGGKQDKSEKPSKPEKGDIPRGGGKCDNPRGENDGRKWDDGKSIKRYQ